MSDNEDLLADDLGDHSLADYNLGNDEEEELLADDFESGPQNVPVSIDTGYNDGSDISSSDYSGHVMPYSQDPVPYQPPVEECVVPNITVEVPNVPVRPPERATYAPYEPPIYEPELAVVPPAIPAAPIESPQIVPSELNAAIPNGEGRSRFLSERPPGAPQRTPQLRDIPDSLDKVFVPRGGFGGARGRTTWRNPQFQARFPPHNHPYRRHNVQRGNFLQQRASFPPPGPRAAPPRPEPLEPAPHAPVGPEISPERPMHPDPFRPIDNRPFNFQPNQRFPYRPMQEPRPEFRPNFEPRFFRPFNPRPFPPREIIPNSNHMPQITIRQALPGLPLPPNVPKIEEFGPKREPEVRMLPVQLPPNLPGVLTGKKVLINPHFKGNFQPPTEGPIKDIDDAAERFIAEQRNALARAAARKPPRRSPQRYVENTTIEIENELAARETPRTADDDDLLRRQEEFIHANRAGLRRRMRSPSPAGPAARRSRSPSPSPRRSPERRRPDPRRPTDEDNEYRRRVREQENLRARVLRAKEVRRRKNAVALHKELQDKERQRTESKDKPEPKPEPPPARAPSPPPPRPDTTRSPAREAQGGPRPLKPETAEANSTCEDLTPPRASPSPPRALTPPLPDKDKEDKRYSDDDDLAFILGDIDDMLSDDDDSGRFKEKAKKAEPTTAAPAAVPSADLRAKLAPRAPRQKIVFATDREREREREPKRRREKSPPAKKPAVTSSTKTDAESSEKKTTKSKQTSELISNKSRQKIIFETKEREPVKQKDDDKKSLPRRVVLQRKVTQTKEKSVFSRIDKNDPTQPNPGIFSRAVRTAIGSDKPRIVVKKDEPEIEYDSESDDEDKLLNEETGIIADVTNLPHGITDTRLKTLAGSEVQSLSLDKEDRSAKITFKTTVAADAFRKKFNNKMVAASRLTVTLR